MKVIKKGNGMINIKIRKERPGECLLPKEGRKIQANYPGKIRTFLLNLQSSNYFLKEHQKDLVIKQS